MSKVKPNFRRFAREILGNHPEYALDGGDIQDIAIDCGLLIEVEMQNACGKNCVCAEYDDFPQICLRKNF